MIDSLLTQNYVYMCMYVCINTHTFIYKGIYNIYKWYTGIYVFSLFFKWKCLLNQMNWWKFGHMINKNEKFKTEENFIIQERMIE